MTDLHPPPKEENMMEGSSGAASTGASPTPMDNLNNEINLLRTCVESLLGAVTRCHVGLFGEYQFTPSPDPDKEADLEGSVAQFTRDLRAIRDILRYSLEVAESFEAKI